MLPIDRNRGCRPAHVAIETGVDKGLAPPACGLRHAAGCAVDEFAEAVGYSALAKVSAVKMCKAETFASEHLLKSLHVNPPRVALEGSHILASVFFRLWFIQGSGPFGLPSRRRTIGYVKVSIVRNVRTVKQKIITDQ